MTWLLTYSVIPSFGQSRSLMIEVDEHKRESQLFVHYGGLNMDWMEMAPSWKDPKHGVRPQRLDLSFLEASAIRDAICGCRIIPMPTAAVGLDGVTYELELRAGFHFIAFRWWSELPAEWAPLARPVEQIEQLFKRVQA